MVEPAAARLIAAHDAVREGRRPERTVYAITGAGRREIVDWLTELVGTRSRSTPQFEAALSLIAALPPDEVIDLLGARRPADAESVGTDTEMRQLAKQDLPELFPIEWEYTGAAPCRDGFVDGLIDRLRAGTLDGVDVWRRTHGTGELPADSDWRRAVRQRVPRGADPLVRGGPPPERRCNRPRPGCGNTAAGDRRTSSRPQAWHPGASHQDSQRRPAPLNA